MNAAELKDKYLRQIGALCLLQAELGGGASSIDVLHFVVPPVTLEQARFYFDDRGDLTGFVSWAWITQEVLDRIDASGSCEMHVSEWCEGPLLLVVDFIVAPNIRAAIRRDILLNVFKGESVMFSSRVKC